MLPISVVSGPWRRAAKQAIEADSFNVVADASYSNEEQVVQCEAAGMMPFVTIKPHLRTFSSVDAWVDWCASRNRHRDNGL
jgi:hypothetical protein